MPLFQSIQNPAHLFVHGAYGGKIPPQILLSLFRAIDRPGQQIGMVRDIRDGGKVTVLVIINPFGRMVLLSPWGVGRSKVDGQVEGLFALRQLI